MKQLLPLMHAPEVSLWRALAPLLQRFVTRAEEETGAKSKAKVGVLLAARSFTRAAHGLGRSAQTDSLGGLWQFTTPSRCSQVSRLAASDSGLAGHAKSPLLRLAVLIVAQAKPE